jgi:putative PEP-CTERM system histidine kinase
VSFGTLSYGLAAFAFALLGALLLPQRREWFAPEYRLFFVSWGSAGWGALLAADVRYGLLSLPMLVSIEILHAGLWLWLLASLAKLQRQPRWLIATMHLAAPAGAAAALSFGMVRAESVQVLMIAGLAVALVGLLSLEQVYRNAARAGLTPARWLCLGIASIFVVDLFFFAQSLLVQDFDRVAWDMRGLLSAFAVLPIAFAARRMPSWSVGLFVSRQVVFYSTSFLLVGAYLLLMSAGGLLVRETGGRWGPMAQLLFLAVAGLLLVALVFSGDVRRRLRTFFAKHFFRNKYDYRAEWLRFVDTLTQREIGESVQQRSIRAVAQIIDSPQGALWLRASPSGSYRVVAQWPRGPSAVTDTELPSQEVAEDAPLPLFLGRTKWVVDLRELDRKPELYDGLFVDSAVVSAGSKSLIVPLLHNERLYGFVQLVARTHLEELTYEDRDLLRTVGLHVAAHLSEAEMDRRLSESRQFEAFNRFSAFVLHDLKNSIAQLQLVLHNAERHKRNPNFVEDALATISNTVERMSKVLAQLGQGDVSGSIRDVDLADVVEHALQRAGARKPVPRALILARPRVMANADRLASIVEHIVRNAQEATSESGDVSVEVSIDDDIPLVKVRDNGHGMDPEFLRDRLFRPFDSTKSGRGMGIGAYQAREYMRSLGGEVRVHSTPGAGTTFELAFMQARSAVLRGAKSV